MRLIRFILSSLVFSITFVIVLAAEYATLALITLPGGSGVVERVHLFPDPEDTDITYSDAITFWSTDIQQSLVVEGEKAEYTIRAWFEWDVWSENMGWADYALSQAKAVIVPILAPVYEVKELYVYYGRDIRDPEFGDNFNDQFGNFINYQIAVGDYLSNNYENMTIKQYQFFHNLEIKLAKYNAVAVDEQTGQSYSVFKKYVEKFINYSGDLEGVRGEDYEFESVDALSAFLFYQLFLAIVLSAYFTYQNPIVISKNSIGENEVEGKIFPRFPRIGLKNRKNKEKGSASESK
jgi:hypothetical protein